MKKKSKAGNGASNSSTSTTPPVTAQPQSKQQAAVQAEMFLYTDDAWSNAYFNEDDLHCMERKLFG
jgi:hypothetical protein